MQKESFYFDSRDGKSKLYAVRYLPDDGQVRGVVQIVHGMAEYVERYEEFAEFLTEKGFAVTGEDHLGHGKSVPEGGTYGFFCEQDPATVVVRDVHRLKKMTQALYPNGPYILLGHSMGSIIVRNYICRYGTGISAAVIMGTSVQSKSAIWCAKLYAKWQEKRKGSYYVSTELDKLVFRDYSKRVTEPKTSFDWLTKEEDVVKKYMEDPLCGFTFTVNGFATLFELISRAQDEKNMANIPEELPVFLVAGADDPVGHYGDDLWKVFYALRKMQRRDSWFKLFFTDRHEILNETDKYDVMNEIMAFFEKKVL